MEKYDVKQLVEKIYELDVKVYEATGSTMGKVFPAGKDLSVKKMLKHLDEDKRHFIRVSAEKNLKNSMKCLSSIILLNNCLIVL